MVCFRRPGILFIYSCAPAASGVLFERSVSSDVAWLSADAPDVISSRKPAAANGLVRGDHHAPKDEVMRSKKPAASKAIPHENKGSASLSSAEEVMEQQTEATVRAAILSEFDIDSDHHLNLGELSELRSRTGKPRVTEQRYLTICKNMGANPRIGLDASDLEDYDMLFLQMRGDLVKDFQSMLEAAPPRIAKRPAKAASSVQANKEDTKGKQALMMKTIFATFDEDKDGLINLTELHDLQLSVGASETTPDEFVNGCYEVGADPLSGLTQEQLHLTLENDGVSNVFLLVKTKQASKPVDLARHAGSEGII